MAIWRQGKPEAVLHHSDGAAVHQRAVPTIAGRPRSGFHTFSQKNPKSSSPSRSVLVTPIPDLATDVIYFYPMHCSRQHRSARLLKLHTLALCICSSDDTLAPALCLPGTLPFLSGDDSRMVVFSGARYAVLSKSSENSAFVACFRDMAAPMTPAVASTTAT
jgi:hypothetical protein